MKKIIVNVACVGRLGMFNVSHKMIIVDQVVDHLAYMKTFMVVMLNTLCCFSQGLWQARISVSR